MKIIKLLVTMSLINAVIVMGIAWYGGSRVVPIVSPSPTSSPMPITTPTPTAKTPTPTSVATPTPTIAPTLTPKPLGCVIQIDGISYEITSLRQTHSGGDVFQCGTDMSALFWKKHSSRILQIMQQYKI